jgi:hypothetical protein
VYAIKRLSLTMYGRKLPEKVAISDLQPGLLPLVLEILGIEADASV